MAINSSSPPAPLPAKAAQGSEAGRAASSDLGRAHVSNPTPPSRKCSDGMAKPGHPRETPPPPSFPRKPVQGSEAGGAAPPDLELVHVPTQGEPNADQGAFRGLKGLSPSLLGGGHSQGWSQLALWGVLVTPAAPLATAQIW